MRRGTPGQPGYGKGGGPHQLGIIQRPLPLCMFPCRLCAPVTPAAVHKMKTSKSTSLPLVRYYFQLPPSIVTRQAQGCTHTPAHTCPFSVFHFNSRSYQPHSYLPAEIWSPS